MGRRSSSSKELGHELGWKGVSGPATAQQWEDQKRPVEHQSQQQQWRVWQEGEGEAEDDERQEQTRGGARERRIDVEWEGGQLFLVIRRVVASEFFIDLVNK